VIPVFNEQEGIRSLWDRLVSVTTALAVDGTRFEVLFIDDGSTDGTVDEIRETSNHSVLPCTIIRFSRNFGQQAGVSAGMRHATGDAIVFLDADLQDPPELIKDFLVKFHEGYDVVYGVRQNRKDALLLRLCFGAFYRLLNALSERPIPLDAGDFSLISARVAKIISEMPEQDRLVRCLRSWVGFRQTGVPYDRPERFLGETKYRFWSRVEGALDGIFSFTRIPIRFGALVGGFVTFIGLAYLTVSYLGYFFFGGAPVSGWLSLMTLGFILGGANLVFTAIVGEYICRVYFQTKNRPLFIIDEVIKNNDHPSSSAHEQP